MSTNQRLCLHFDINKTIIMSDIGAGRDLLGTINSLLSECTWGLYSADKHKHLREVDDWVICHNEPGVVPPVINSVTFGTFLEDFTGLEKKERTRLKTAYTHNGEVGERFSPFVDTICKSLQLSERVNEVTDVDDLFHQGCCHILPSFFVMVEYLVQEQIDFRIVFRTFGVDIANVAREFNVFCEGRHPYHPYTLPYKLDGSDSRYARDLRLQLSQTSGSLRRDGTGSDGVHLSIATSREGQVLIIEPFLKS